MADALLQDLWFHHADDVALDSITITPRRVTLHATTTSSAAVCPSCGTVPTRVHSRYVRLIDEAATAGRRASYRFAGSAAVWRHARRPRSPSRYPG